jgi:hypothetical protein
MVSRILSDDLKLKSHIKLKAALKVANVEKQATLAG